MKKSLCYRSIGLIAIAGLIIGSTMEISGNQIAWGRKVEFVIPDFAQQSPENARISVLDLGAKRDNVLSELSNQLRRDALTPLQRVLVINAISQQQDIQATTVLITYLNLKLPAGVSLPIDADDSLSLGEYPAVDALVRLQSYSVAAILRSLPKEQKPLRRKLMFDVIEQVEGPKIGRMVFDRRIEQIQKSSQRLPLKDQVPFMDEIAALKVAKTDFENQFPLPPQ